MGNEISNRASNNDQINQAIVKAMKNDVSVQPAISVQSQQIIIMPNELGSITISQRQTPEDIVSELRVLINAELERTVNDAQNRSSGSVLCRNVMRNVVARAPQCSAMVQNKCLRCEQTRLRDLPECGDCLVLRNTDNLYRVSDLPWLHKLQRSRRVAEILQGWIDQHSGEPSNFMFV